MPRLAPVNSMCRCGTGIIIPSAVPDLRFLSASRICPLPKVRDNILPRSIAGRLVSASRVNDRDQLPNTQAFASSDLVKRVADAGLQPYAGTPSVRRGKLDRARDDIKAYWSASALDRASMIPDREIWQPANLMIKPHGSEAAIQAPMPADELLERVTSTARRGGRRSCALSISCTTRTRLAECVEAGRRRLLMGFGVSARVGDC
jgi:hypothetical protein